MGKLAPLSLLMLAACVAYADEPVEATAQTSDRLAAALEGRVAGPPVSCVSQRQIDGNRIIDERTILFEGLGSTVYVNRTRSACAGAREWHAIRRLTIGASMCEGELIVPFDPTSGTEYGGCSLGEFVPYRRPS